MKKNIFACLSKVLMSLILCMGILSSTNVSALEYVPETFNEYDLILDQINNIKKSRSVDSIDLKEALKDLDILKEHIYSMKEWSLNELKAANYTEDQIYNIQNYDGSDKMTQRAAALVTRSSYTFPKNQYSKSDNRTDVTVNAVYDINGVPSPNLNAALAIGLSDGGIWYDTGSGSMTINYTGYANNSMQYATKTTSGEVASNSTGARKFQFALHTNNTAGHLCYAKKLTVTFSAGRQGKIDVTQCTQQFSRQALFGSASISFKVVSVSLDLGGTGQIDFGAFQNKLQKTVS